MNKAILIALVGAGLLGYAGSLGMQAFNEKASQQQTETDVVQRWKNSYQALAKSRATWDRRYPELAKYNDLLGLFRGLRLERYGLSADPDQLSTSKIESVRHNDMPVGLVRVCIASSAAATSSGLQVRAPTYSALLAGVGSLATRKDVEMSAITVSTTAAGEPEANLADFCMLLRNEVKA
ncbi:TPA: hypothetical protein ACOEBF_001322 [Stenotrophomonas maltophilia]|uniref:hypothetical protein n=1 Tax=Stenotrophomonas maltophilia TaxID=40324 RepID=UPI0021C8380A|nr:hypothetical protein [Stenotrophomonas maltophilia]MCU1142269.1 hypothetical protein [Stenotrophomonas maltophilia]